MYLNQLNLTDQQQVQLYELLIIFIHKKENNSIQSNHPKRIQSC